MVISQLISECSRIIGTSSETALLDARIIVREVLGLDDIGLVIRKDDGVSSSDAKCAERMANMRKNHMPIAYIIGHREFMSLDFSVETGVLIPRPDTECIVETVLKEVGGGRILDIGTGSGAIAVSLAKYIPGAKVSAVDISDKALKTAEFNAKANGVAVEFIKADIFNFNTDRIFDCVVSNPPYIKTADIGCLMSDVRDFEPHTALDGGADGLDFYRAIAAFCKTNLIRGGKLFLEHGYDQFGLVKKILSDSGFENIKEIYDLAGIKRGCAAVLRS